MALDDMKPDDMSQTLKDISDFVNSKDTNNVNDDEYTRQLLSKLPSHEREVLKKELAGRSIREFEESSYSELTAAIRWATEHPDVVALFLDRCSHMLSAYMMFRVNLDGKRVFIMDELISTMQMGILVGMYMDRRLNGQS